MKQWYEQYKRRYAQLKASGKSFFPYAVFKDTVMAFLLLAILVFLAHHFGAGLEDLADPTDSTYNPRPEWYFLFLFQTLKLFPGKLEAVAAVILPGLGVLVLVLIPFLDRGPRRHPFRRPIWTGLGIAALAAIGFQTWEGYRSPLTNPIIEKDPLVMTGQRLYRSLNCAYCHKIAGKGGTVGPELDKVVGAESTEFLAQHFRDPQKSTPGSAMPKLNLLPDEIQALTVYLKSVGGDISFTPEAVEVFSENCSACHRIGKEGGDVGPDLSQIGTIRDKPYIQKYISDPTSLNSSAAMPGFKGQLTQVQIEDLASYLSSQGRK